MIITIENSMSACTLFNVLSILLEYTYTSNMIIIIESEQHCAGKD